MWPKAISSLIELAPHITRLLPMADRFFQSKSDESDASRTAMQQMAEGLRGDLGQVTASHAGLYRQLNEQSVKLTDIAAELTSAHRTINALSTRLTSVESSASTARLLLILNTLGLTAILILMLIFHHTH